jgi:hypothetical protein
LQFSISMTASTRFLYAPLLAATSSLIACGPADGQAGVAANDTATIEQNLMLVADEWPGRSIQVCWDPDDSGARSDFPTLSVIAQEAIWRSWTQYSGLRFTGWGICGSDVSNTIDVHLMDHGLVDSSTGYNPAGVRVNLAPFRSDFDTTVIHEFGHALGYVHEANRPDFNFRCRSDKTSNGDPLNTPPDYYSIMASTGYCTNERELSYWDISGQQHAYGFPNYFADVTGDGRADAILVNSDHIVVRTSNGAGFPASTQSNWTAARWMGHKGTAFADATGDGKADAIGVDDDGIYVRPSNGSSFPSPSLKWTSGSWYGIHGTYFADVTGDGKADAIGVDDDTTRVLPSNGSSFAGPNQDFGPCIPKAGQQFFADVTGDGKADSITVTSDPARVQVCVSTGSSFGSIADWTGNDWFGARATGVADVDGDGKADLIAVNSNAVLVRRSTGSSFSSTVQTFISSAWYGARGTYFADTNNDHKADIIGVDEGGVYVRLSTGSSYPLSSPNNWTQGSYYAGR